MFTSARLAFAPSVSMRFASAIWTTVALFGSFLMGATPSQADSRLIELNSYMSVKYLGTPETGLSLQLIPKIPNSVYGDRAGIVQIRSADGSWLGGDCARDVFYGPCTFSVPNQTLYPCLYNEPYTGYITCYAISYIAAVPTAPTIVAGDISSHTVSVDFTAPNDAGGTTITNYQYSLDGGATWTTMSPAQTTSPIVISGLTNGKSYSVTLRALNASGPGAAANCISVTPATTADAPTITSVVAGSHKATVMFNPPSDNGGAEITNYAYSTDDGASWTEPSPSQTASPLVITGLANGLNYSVRIRAINAVGSSAPSNAVSAMPRTAASAPTVSSVLAGNHQATVNFSAPADNGGAEITNYEYTTDGGQTWRAASPVQTTSPLVITGLINGVTYAVRIRAVNNVVVTNYRANTGLSYHPKGNLSLPARTVSKGEIVDDLPANSLGWLLADRLIEPVEVSIDGVASDAVSVKPVTTASAPTITGVLAGNGQVTLSLSAPAEINDESLVGYDYSTNNGSTWSHFAALTGPFTIAGLTNGTVYQVNVRAVNSAGAGDASAAMTVYPTKLIPAKPVIESIVGGNGSATVNIAIPKDVTSQSITGYQYSIDKGRTYQNAAVSNGSFSIAGLTNGVSTSVQIRATNFNGNSPASVAKTVVPATPPAAPSITKITASTGALSIAFTAPSSGGSAITGYHYSLDGGLTWFIPAKAIKTSPIKVTGLPNATTAQVKVRAVNVMGIGLASDAVRASTPVLVPSAPVTKSISATSTTFTVDVTAPVYDGGGAITNYAYSIDNGKTWNVVSPASDSTRILIAGLKPNTLYPVQIAAINSAGRGASSAKYSARSLP